MSAELHRRVTITLRSLTIGTAIAAGIALAFLLMGHPHIALAAVIAIIFAQVIAIETLRAFAALHSRDPR
ncbi:hypothetical protein [Sphingomonas yabuuchiae]|uniref:FtsH-binding integral membrane protein n=1 Tax=Sphingomonas yabuuchiae TaxID=172044 RepID=A0AA40ZX33_9SPHN|nr:hypothetical protein [Sphingomonas yabuuchiae]MBB4609618.1 FtsH-binding integral membrane protein [Sphingomonas yabuuchiae]MBN3557931.1 hypothetical protein [Sphingomonas yabuuchiae]